MNNESGQVVDTAALAAKTVEGMEVQASPEEMSALLKTAQEQFAALSGTMDKLGRANVVPIEKVGIPISADQVTPQMEARRQQQEQGAAMMQAAADMPGVPGQRYAETLPQAEPHPDMITEVPAAPVPEAAPAAPAPTEAPPV